MDYRHKTELARRTEKFKIVLINLGLYQNNITMIQDFKTKQAQLIVKYNSDLLPKSDLHKSKATRVYTLLNISQYKTKTL